MFYEFEPDHNASEITKNICCVKGEGAVHHSIVSGNKNLDDPACSGRPKTVDSETVLQDMKAYLTRMIQRVSGEFSILQSSVLVRVHDHDMFIHASRQTEFLARYFLYWDFWEGVRRIRTENYGLLGNAGPKACTFGDLTSHRLTRLEG